MSEYLNRNEYSTTIPELKDKAGNPAKARVVLNNGGQGFIEVEEFVYRGVRHTNVRMWTTTNSEPKPDLNSTWPRGIKWEDRTVINRKGAPLVLDGWRVPNGMRARSGGTWDGSRWVEMSEPTRDKVESILLPVLVQQLTPPRRAKAQLDHLRGILERAERVRDEAKAALEYTEAEVGKALAALNNAVGNLDYSKKGE